MWMWFIVILVKVSILLFIPLFGYATAMYIVFGSRFYKAISKKGVWLNSTITRQRTSMHLILHDWRCQRYSYDLKQVKAFKSSIKNNWNRTPSFSAFLIYQILTSPSEISHNLLSYFTWYVRIHSTCQVL